MTTDDFFWFDQSAKIKGLTVERDDDFVRFTFSDAPSIAVHVEDAPAMAQLLARVHAQGQQDVADRVLAVFPV